MKILILLMTLFLTTRLVFADAVIFSGQDVKALKYNLDLFGRSKVMGLNVDPSAGAGVAAPLGSIGMDYLTGEVYYKNGAGNTQWISWSGAIEGPANTFAAYDSNGILDAMPGWSYLNNATNYETVINPTVPATLTDYFALIDRVTFDNITTVGQYGSYIIDSNIGPTTATTIDNVTGLRSQMEFGPFATITNTPFIFEDANNTVAGAVIDNYNSMYIHPVFDHATMVNYRGVEVSALLGNTSAHANTGSFNAFQSNSSFGANSNMATVTSFSAFDNFQAGAVVDDYYFATHNTNINSTNVNSLTGLATNFQVGNAANTEVNFQNGVSIATNVYPGSKVVSWQGINFNPQFQAGSDLDDGNYLNLGGALDSTAINSFTDININTNIGSAVATTITNQTGININPNFAANATIGDYRGLNIRPNSAAGATITNSFTGLDIGSNSAIPVGGGGATGISVDMSNFTTTTQKYAASFQNGAFNANSPISSADPFFAMSMSANYMGGQFSIPNGSPVAGGEFVFGNNLAVSLLADDDMPADGTGLGLGFGVVGFVAQGAVTAGHTVEDFNLALGGFGIPAFSTGGTITNAVMFKALGALPQGGTLTIDNMFGFRAGAGLSLAGATNVWGISIEDPNAENFFEKSLAIDTGTKKVSAATVGLEIGNGKDLIAEGEILTKDSLSFEDPGVGTNKISFIADTLTADRAFIWPDSVGTAGYALVTDGAGILNWQIPNDVNAIKQSGNTFGVNVSMGTNDAFNVNIRTNGSNIATFDQNGFLAINGSAAPTASAALDVQGTDGAILYPRLTTVQRNALTAIAGMMIYNTTTSAFECYSTSWIPCGSAMVVDADLTLTAADSIAINTFVGFQQWRVQGGAAAVTLSGTPFGTTNPVDGSQITLVGTDDSFTVSLAYTDAADGYVGPDITIGKYDTVTVQYNSALDRYVFVSSSL
jgi:hypothetical protein